MLFIAAFTAGVLSFFSPCVFPLIPSYILYLAGVSSVVDPEKNRRHIIITSILFILGFSFVFIMFGAAAAYLGKALYGFKEIMRIIGGALLIFFGLFVMGVFKFGFLYIERKFEARKPIGYLGSFIVGMTFAAAWTPCVGPILGSILVLAGASSTLYEGIILLVFYSLGLAIPFFLTALLIDLAFVYFKKIQKYLGILQVVSGILLVIVGIIVILDYFKIISSFIG